MAVDDSGSGRLLVAYWAPVEREDTTSLDLAEYLRRQLPDYMIPASFVKMDSLPLTAGGKLDRQALLTAGTSLTNVMSGQVAPRTPLEQTLATIWAEVLPVAEVGIHDDFFAIGGHSLAAVQVASRIGQYLAVEMPLRTLFEHPTVAGLAQQLSLLKATAEIRPVEERDEFVF
jgi:acyl carrier protein